MAKKARHKRGLLVVISGPSGVGKSTVVRRLMKTNPDLALSVSMTTRQARPGEVNGEHYYFVTQAEFDKRVKDGDLLEWAKVHGSYYGTPRSYVEKELSQGGVVVLEVDVQGAASIKQAVEKSMKAAVVFIFLIPPSVDILAFRLKKRKTEDEAVMNYRLRAAIAELQVMEKYDYIVVNDKVESASDKIRAIINVEKERTLLN